MKENTKKEIKEWAQVFGLAVLVVAWGLSLNSTFAASDSKQPAPQDSVANVKDAAKTITPRDSVIMMNKIRTR